MPGFEEDYTGAAATHHCRATMRLYALAHPHFFLDMYMCFMIHVLHGE
jgi:ABC-type uncharacterized transport system substrate-binding protein